MTGSIGRAGDRYADVVPPEEPVEEPPGDFEGRSTERAKAIAAATVVKHHNVEGHAKSK